MVYRKKGKGEEGKGDNWTNYVSICKIHGQISRNGICAGI